MSKRSQSRSQRRSYERILKKMDPGAYKEFKKDSIARGREIHRQNMEDQLRRDGELDNPTETITLEEPEVIDVQAKK
jgi:hypothetical protein